MAVRAFIAAIGVGLLSTPAAGQDWSAAVAHELTREDLEKWLDGFLPVALDQGDVAGAVVVVVKDGQPLLQKGYGHADVQKETPVDPERTLFHPGSVSKLFTYTAVMQLVERGKLDLDRDINEYLDFEVPPAFGKPITLRHLMTHTPGFEDTIEDIFHADAADLPSLEAYVKAMLPARIFPPGEVPAYSNYGTALAGYIVERTSGEEFAGYIERHILKPLGMLRSTFRQPLPASLAVDMSQGYDLGSGPPGVYELVGPAPAGSLAATGADMARFMTAHLQMAQGAEGGVLAPRTARLMHTPAARAIEPLNGFTLGFFESDRNGRRIISHGGDTKFFHTELSLFLDEGVGLFFCINSDGTADADLNIRTALFQQFTDRYFPAPVQDEPTVSTAREHARLLAQSGPYEFSLRSESGFLAFEALLGQIGIEVNDDGAIVVPAMTGFNGRPKVWREVGPYVWQEIDGKQRLAARIVDGQVRALGIEPYASVAVLQPVPAARSAGWILPLLAGAAIVLLLTVIGSLSATLVRRHYGVGVAMTGRELLAHRCARVAALINLVFLLGWVLLIATVDLEWADAADVRLRLLQLAGFLGIVGAGAAVWNAWLTCRARRSPWVKGWSVLLAATCLAVISIALAFNLITVRLNY